MIKYKKTEIPIYFGDLIIVQSNDLRAVSDKFSLELDEEDFSAKYQAQSVNITKDGYTAYYLIFEKKNVSYGIIAHEASHFVTHLFTDRGIVLDNHNDESFAYMLGWTVNRCHETIKNVVNQKN